MFTQCPTCKTVFNVKPEQLKVAAGKVRCSRCQGIFNANEHRYDTESATSTQAKSVTNKAAPKPAAKPQVKPEAPKTAPKKPAQSKNVESKPPAKSTNSEKPAPVESETDDWFDLTPFPNPVVEKKATPPSTPPEESRSLSEKEKQPEPEVKRPVDAPPPSVEDELNEDLFKLFDTPEEEEPSAPVPESTPSAESMVEKEPAARTESKHSEKEKSTEIKKETSKGGKEEKSVQNEGGKSDDKSATNGYSLPPQLMARPVRATMKTVFYAISILLLIAALAAQYAFSQRIPLRENARLRPWVDALCKVANCPMPPKRDLSKIELVDNMMQSHPRYQDSLLITATLINRADYVQPYPIVEITMTDLKQKVVAQRTFRPEEYLVGDTAEIGFTPNIEVALMLEVADPGNNAVGFKFDFY